MAYVASDLADFDAAASSRSVSIPTPSAGDLISCFVVQHRSDRDITSVTDQNGDPFSVAVDSTNEDLTEPGGSIWYKIAEGDETSIELTFEGNARHTIIWAIESEIDGSAPLDGANRNEAFAGTPTKSVSTNAANASTDDGVVYYFVCNAEDQKWNNTQTTAGTVIEQTGATIYSGGALVRERYASSGSKSATLSTAADGTEVWAAVAVFKGAGGGAIAPDDLAQAQALDATGLSQSSSVAPSGIEQVQSVDSPTLGVVFQVAPSDIDQQQSVEQPGLTQTHIIAPAGLLQSQALDGVAITQAHVVSVDSLAQVQTVESPALTQAHSLLVNSLFQAQTVDGASLVEAGAIAVHELTQGQSVAAVSLTQAHSLVADDVLQAQIVAATSLIQAGTLNPGSLAQAQVVDAATLVQHLQVAPGALLQAQSVEVTGLGVSISPDSLAQAQALDSVSMTYAAVIAANDLSQAQALDVASFGGIVVGELQGEVVIYAAIGGVVDITPTLTGTVTIH